MLLTNFKMLTEAEIRLINSKLSKFGTRNYVASGSCVNGPEGKVYHITLEEDNRFKTNELIQSIGKIIKENTGAAEVYFLGRKMA